MSQHLSVFKHCSSGLCLCLSGLCLSGLCLCLSGLCLCLSGLSLCLSGLCTSRTSSFPPHSMNPWGYGLNHNMKCFIFEQDVPYMRQRRNTYVSWRCVCEDYFCSCKFFHRLCRCAGCPRCASQRAASCFLALADQQSSSRKLGRPTIHPLVCKYIDLS